MSDSPNSLSRPKIKVAKLDSKIVYIAIGVGVLLIIILIMAVNSSTQESNQETTNLITPVSETDLKQALESPEWATGLALPPEETEKRVDIPEPQPERPLVTVVRASEPSEAEKRHIQELLEMRKFKQAQMKAALTAPLKIKSASADKTSVEIPQTTSSLADIRSRHPLTIPGVATGIPRDDDDRKEKEAFLGSRAAKDGSWQLPYERVPGKKFELKTGSVISGIMISGINSDLPGQISGQVSKNIYDTATGSHLLIPQGARMIGVYDSRVTTGQSRVLVAWNRIIFPDGSSITLGIMPGTDIAGYAGYSGDVDNHYLRTFGSAAIMSLISGGMAYAMDTFNRGSSSRDNPSLQDELGTALSSQLGQSTLQLLQSNSNLKPAISTEPGKRYNMVVTKDIVFARPYKPYRN
ncbi:TrbI/VirB10 family protein [Maridesulfovibrio frigidus]|uniref:TrbI/VirB10 family protein n=1 Tax=Maridesulfovibrio frigidus TaxID=340956 RepID=UPI0004E1423B|nr:TrbI/VirB10 family protein [Maridesulfovibrio frigidus]